MDSYKITDSGHDLRFFMDEKLRRSVNIEQGLQAFRKLMDGVKTTGYTAFLPDYTPANSLPVGTCFLIDSEQRINPSWIGIDIGCGYNLIELDIDTKKVYKKGKINRNRLEKITQDIDSILINWSNTKYDKINLDIDGIQNSADRYLGSLGQGNHFIDLFHLNNVIDKNAFSRYDLNPDKLFILIHSGSRETGFMIHNHFAEKFKSKTHDFNESYLNAMKIARNYAKSNRKRIAELIADKMDCNIKEIFDQDHNAVDECYYNQKSFLRIRKGATLTQKNKPSIIPGNCISPAFLVKPGTNIADSYHTLPHGSGRKYPRAQLFSKYAKSKKLTEFFKTIELNVNPKKMIEEIPQGYKPVNDIIKALQSFKLAKPVATLQPLAVIVDRK